MVLVSGGVDSAVSLRRLIAAGFTPFAVTMLLPQFCGNVSDGKSVYEVPEGVAETAVSLTESLGVSHAVLDVRDIFIDRVIEPFAGCYRSGLTPNPCVRCNPRMKFGLMREWAEKELGVRMLATGHYAGIVERDGRHRLARVHPVDKDQSYFLYRIPPDDLAFTRFPLSDVSEKSEVRAEARALGLAGADADDSMDICFLPEGDYRPLVVDAALPGPIVDESGKELGRHNGYMNFTIGQRKGFGIGFGRPMYVLRLDPEKNAVVVGPRESAHRRDVLAHDLVVHDAGSLKSGSKVWAKIRSGGRPRQAEVTDFTDSLLRVRFDEPVFAPAPGQHLVLYDDDGVVLGGGEIRVKS
jgi:tRNA (5-methylaminomethyl-2-thiouridylate)-methyltransferase